MLRACTLSVLLIFALPHSFQLQSPQQRDTQAMIILQQATKKMANSLPSDCSATGTITIVAGSETDNGTIQLVTRGTDQTSEAVQTASLMRRAVYSGGRAQFTEGSATHILPMEPAASSQSLLFPLPILTGAISNPEIALEYRGLESLDGQSAYHIRFWNTFSSVPDLRDLAPFTQRDLWIDVESGLLRKLSFNQRESQGDAPLIAVSVLYSDYRDTSGVLFPFLIEKSLNGTPWSTVRIGNVTFNNGFTDLNFPVQ